MAKRKSNSRRKSVSGNSQRTSQTLPPKTGSNASASPQAVSAKSVPGSEKMLSTNTLNNTKAILIPRIPHQGGMQHAFAPLVWTSCDLVHAIGKKKSQIETQQNTSVSHQFGIGQPRFDLRARLFHSPRPSQTHKEGREQQEDTNLALGE